MIKFKLALIGILFSGITLAQSVPQGINYQAVALDQSGQPIPGVDIVGRPIDGAEIGVRISILENSAGGPVLYQEDHEVRTDLYGMFNLVIGEGLQLSVGSFPSIDWKGDKYLKVELSVDNDGDFKVSAIQQLMSVPYAFLAENAITAETALDVDDADADPQNEIQSISLRGDTILLSNGGFVVLPPDQVNDADADPLNEIQALSLSNDTVYLSNGGFIVLPTDQINDADADPLNEIQTLSKVGDTISLSGGGSVQVFDGDYSNLNNAPSIPSKTSDLINDSGYLTTEIDGSVTNEIQVLSISNDTIFLSDGGFVVLPAGFDGDYNSLVNTPSIPSKTSDLVNDSGYLNAEIDGSITNELQTLSLSSDTLYLSDGGKVPTSSLGPEYTILSATTGLGTGWYISLEKDGVPQSDFFRVNAGNGISLSGNNSTDYTITNLSNDMDSTNELQTLSMSGDTLFLSNGGFVQLPQQNLTALKAISSLDLDEYPFNLRYTGNGKNGRFDSGDSSAFVFGGWGYSTNQSVRILEVEDFILRSGHQIQIPSGTTYLLVQDSCVLDGSIFGNGLTGSSPSISTNGIGANIGTWLGDDSGACHEIDNSSNSLTVSNQDRSLIRFDTRVGRVVNTLSDTNLIICAAHYGSISGMSSQAKSSACSNNYNYVRTEGGRGLVIIAKHFISDGGSVSLQGQNGLKSGVNISGAGGGGSCLISSETRDVNSLQINTSGGMPWPSSGLTRGQDGISVFISL